MPFRIKYLINFTREKKTTTTKHIGWLLIPAIISFGWMASVPFFSVRAKDANKLIKLYTIFTCAYNSSWEVSRWCEFQSFIFDFFSPFLQFFCAAEESCWKCSDWTAKFFQSPHFNHECNKPLIKLWKITKTTHKKKSTFIINNATIKKTQALDHIRLFWTIELVRIEQEVWTARQNLSLTFSVHFIRSIHLSRWSFV